MSGGPVSVAWAKQNVPAILTPGEEAGTAVASVLFGDFNPAGRLPYTVYNSVADVPPQNEYDVTKGFTYMYYPGKPQFAFGHGLSFTTFRYGAPHLSSGSIARDGKATVMLEVENTGARAGGEVVQLYVHAAAPRLKRPAKELRGFQRITLSRNRKRRSRSHCPLRTWRIGT